MSAPRFLPTPGDHLSAVIEDRAYRGTAVEVVRALYDHNAPRDVSAPRTLAEYVRGVLARLARFGFYTPHVDPAATEHDLAAALLVAFGRSGLASVRVAALH